MCMCAQKSSVFLKMYVKATNYICRNCRVLAVLRKRCCEQLRSLVWGVITAIIRHALAFRIRVAPSRIRVAPSRIRVVPSRIRVVPSRIWVVPFRIWVVPSRYSSVTVRWVRTFCYSSVTDMIPLSRLFVIA